MQSSVDAKKISKKQLITIQEELKLDQRQLETALKKIPQWLHAVGVNKNLEKIMIEVIRLTRRYSPYNEVSPRLEKLLKQEFEATKDFVSVESIRAENHLPKNKMTKFMLENKKDSIADFLGVNIFLDSNQSYIRKRKIKAFVNRFFVWLLSNNAAMVGIVVNEEYGILDKFYCLEEIKVGNSKKGRILGFYKSDEGVNCAIVGFYNGQIKFLKAVRRSQEGLVAPKFKQYDYKTPPVTFNFTLETVLDKNNRTLFNLLLRGKENAATKVIWGGRRVRYITDTSAIHLEEFMPKNGMTKAKSNLLINTYGNLNSDDLVKFYNKNLTEKSFCYLKNNTLYFSSKIEPITFWVDPNVKSNFVKFGVAANIDPTILFEQIFSLYENVLGTDGPSDFLNKLDSIYTRQDTELKEKIPVWEKILNTDNFQDTITKIDGILKGRIKCDENTRSFDSDYLED